MIYASAACKRLMCVTFSLLFGGCNGDETPPAETSGYSEIKIQGDDLKNGVSDPSVEYGTDGIGWLAYSVVSIPERVETHLAKSTDHGQSWSFVSVLNPATEATISIRGRDISGYWRHETPSLTYDKDDPGREWKLFWHKYFVKPPFRELDREFSQSWIAYRHAPHPTGPWSDEILILGKGVQPAQVDLNALSPDLAKMRVYMEPGSFVDQGVLYLSLDACTTATGLGDWVRRRIILVASTDHGNSWHYVGTLATGQDAKKMGYAALTASALVHEAGRPYLLVSPSGSSSKKNRGHDGTLVLEFEDLQQAKLRRDAAGQLAPIAHHPCRFNMGGPADYDEQNTDGGIVMMQIRLTAIPRVFQSWQTNTGLLPSTDREVR